MNCREVENKLPSYVDGLETSSAAAIAAHLETCAACRELAHAQSVARAVLRARGAQLAPMAPPGLRTRIIANMPPEPAAPKRGEGGSEPVLAWSGRLTAFAAAAMVVLTIGAVLLPVASPWAIGQIKHGDETDITLFATRQETLGTPGVTSAA